MQSVAKKSDGSNIYKLSDRANGEFDAGELGTGNSNREPPPFGNASSELAAGEKSINGQGVADGASADDALAWLKIIQNATADLTADLRATKKEGGDRSFGEEPAYTGRSQHAAPFEMTDSHSYGDDDFAFDGEEERKLARKFSHGFTERSARPLNVSPARARASLLPYVAATAVFAFVAGGVAVYLLNGDAPAKPDTYRNEAQTAFPRAPAEAASPKGAGAQNSLADEQQTWSQTVQTFQQFVKPVQR